jgi:dihydroorotate dehydrogenase electron transfer subunit
VTPANPAATASGAHRSAGATDAAISAAQKNRDTIFVEEAVLKEKHEYPGEQFMLRLDARKCSRTAVAGSFVHIQCAQNIRMRRPLSIMRANASEGWIEILFKVVGSGLSALGSAEIGDRFSIIGPIGNGFDLHPDRTRPLLIGGGVGIPPMVFLVEQLLAGRRDWNPVVLMGSEIPFPFATVTSSIAAGWLPAGIDSSMRLLEEWGVPMRLASLAGFAGCFEGYVTDLSRIYLDSLTADEMAQTEIFSCGPTPMLQAVADIAAQYKLPCQVSLEEFMACAVGGCAGCAVEVQTSCGPAMRRVCVDGPVFAASSVFS